jgi:hypothetical protein
MNPRCYQPWMTTYEGEMNRIMEEMLREMWPCMSPDGADEPPANVMNQFRLKLSPGHQPGEHPGSLHEALMKEFPQMVMDKKGMEPGVTPKKMVEAMMKGWEQKSANMAEVPPLAMDRDPALRPAACGEPSRLQAARRQP